MRIFAALILFFITLPAIAQRPDQLPRQFNGPPFPGSNGVVHAILNRDTTPQSYGVMFDDIFGSTAQGIPFITYAANTYTPLALVLAAGTNMVFTTNGTTFVLNASGGGSGTVSGTANTVAKFSGATAVGNSQITDDGTNVGIGVTPSEKLQVGGSISTYHASAASGAGYLTHSYTDTTGSTKTNIGMHGIAQYGANERKGAFQVYLSSNGPPAKVFEILNTGALGLNATLPEAVGNAIFHIANPKKSKAEADHWADVGHFSTSYAEANPIALSLGFRTSPTAANRHFFIQATELDDHPIPLILQCIGGTVGVNTSNSIPLAPLTVGSDPNGLGININAHTTEYGLLQFMRNDRTTLEGGIYGQVGRLTFMDSAAADVMNITNGSVGIGTLHPLSPLSVQAAFSGNGTAININGRSDDIGFLQFMENDRTTLEGAIYGAPNRLTVQDAAGTDTLTVTNARVGIGTVNPLTTLHANGVVTLGAATTVTTGTGSPESVVTAPVGSIFLRTDGGTSTTLYVKQSGSGNTGWTAMGSSTTPAPVTLTDAATIATDASLGNHFRVTLGGNRTLGNPTNPTDGQKAIWEVIQDGTGSRTLAMDTKFLFGTDITSITLTTTASKRDLITAVYNSTLDKWLVCGFMRGF